MTHVAQAQSQSNDAYFFLGYNYHVRILTTLKPLLEMAVAELEFEIN
jgi:hypothetical protein